MEINNSSAVKMEQVQQEDERSSIEQVELTVPKTDDPTLPVLTFRTWVLGLVSCVLLSFVNQFFWYRTQPLSVTGISAQIAVVPVGHFMARVLPTRRFFQGTRFEFTMNPGPFNVKEHVLITIFANCGGGTVYATHILTAVKIFYKRKLTFLPAFIVMLTTQVLGFGWAGIFRKYLVEPEKMWWPVVLVQVSLFSALHEKSKRPKGSMTRTQFFLLVMIASFAYYIFPGYLFIMLTSVSWVCWIRPNSILVNQLGSGMKGLGIGSFGIEWSAIAAYLGTPLASPWLATANIAVGFFFVMYVMTPITYWSNIYSAKTFPIFSSKLFMANGSRYEVLDIIDSRFQLDHGEYAKKGPLHMSTFFAFTYGLGFATLSATVMHVLLFNAGDILDSFCGNKKKDVHARLMKSYKSVPTLWFILILVINIALILFACVYYKESLQLPWWGALLACFMAVAFTYPIGVIQATTNQQPGLNIITEYVIGYLYPERPVANMCFKVYGYISMVQGLNFVSDFKLGHYMKIPPRAMFTAQMVGTVVAVVVYQCTAWWLMADIPNLYDTSLLPPDSPWTCPTDRVFFDASVIWGLVGPRRIFGNLGEYSNINWFFLGGAIAPVLVWLAHRIFPKQKWILAVNMPVLLGATAMMPPATALNFQSWIFVAFLSGFVVFRYRQDLWKKYNYVASGALEAGTAFVTILVFITLQSKNIELDWWGNKGELCPLATCPTAKGVVIAGCPVL